MKELISWCKKNNLSFSINGKILNIEGFGKLLYVKEKDGKIIDEDYTFIMEEEEYEILEQNEDVQYLVFKFGSRFYYSSLKESKNDYNEVVFKPEFNDLLSIGLYKSENDLYFCNLGIHTGYELLNGSGEPDSYVKKAKFYNQDFISTIDKNTLGGSLAFQVACQKKGLRFGIGYTATISYNHGSSDDHNQTFEGIFYVKNEIGWRNLLKINKAINVDFDKFVPEEIVLQNSDGLFFVFSRKSILNFYIKNTKKCIEIISKYKKSFGSKNLFFQIDNTEFTNDELDLDNLEKTKLYFENLYDYIKPIYIPDCYYVEKMDFKVKEYLNGIDRISTPHSEKQYFKNIDDILDENLELFSNEDNFNKFLESIENTKKISDNCNFSIDIGNHKLPKFPVKNTEKFYKNLLEEKFESKIIPKLKGNKKKIKQYIERLETENEVIVGAGFIDYFLILWDIVEFCNKEGILVGPGRGSAGGSLVAYLLGIIEIDPIEYNLLFERFLNKARVSGERAKSADSLPDIDMDFEATRRPEVKEYLKRKYSEFNVCSIGTYNRLKTKSALKDFARVKKLQFDEVNYATKEIPDSIVSNWSDIFENAVQKKVLYSFVQRNSEMCESLKASMNQPKSGSIHASAMLVLPKEDKDGNPMTVFEWMPVKNIDGMLVSEWEGKYVERAGFLKEDILGLSQLDKFKLILSKIEENSGKKINLNDIPVNEKSVFEYFQKGWNEDVFQFGTSGLKSYSKLVKPDCIEDLIAMNALYRPGPMESDSHNKFAKIKHGKLEAEFDKGMEAVTEDTHGLYVFQEQIMQAMVVGGLTLVQADEVRTYMKKKDFDSMDKFRKEFLRNYSKIIGSEESAQKTWDKLFSFSAYGFNKSHSAAYSLMGYWSQWLKVNYPLEFWTASLNFAKDGEEEQIPNRLQEISIIGNGIEVKQPDINKSGIEFACDPETDTIYWSLTKIKNAGNVAIKTLLEIRQEKGEFFSLTDFLHKVPKTKVNKRVVISFIISGAFDSIGGEDDCQINSPKERKKILKKYCEIINSEVPEICNNENSNQDWFWILEQKKLTGFGELDFKSLIQTKIKKESVRKLFISPDSFSTKVIKDRFGIPCLIAGSLNSAKFRKYKKGEMCRGVIESNNNMIEITLWDEIVQKYKKQLEELEKNQKIFAISGVIRFDNYKGKNILMSDEDTKIYEL